MVGPTHAHRAARGGIMLSVDTSVTSRASARLLSVTVACLALVACGGETSSGEDTWEVVIEDGMAEVPEGVVLTWGQEFNVAPFRMDVFEVTVEEFAGCVEEGSCLAAVEHEVDERCNGGAVERGNHPINCVAFEDAQAYCAWRGKRLPTEVEWTWAAFGPDFPTYPWGEEEPRDRVCWSGGSAGERESTCPIDAFPLDVTHYGVRGMGGNVNEFATVVSDGSVFADCAVVAWSRSGVIGYPNQGCWHGFEPVPSPPIGFRCATELE